MVCHDHLGSGHTTMISYLPVGCGNHGIIYNLNCCNHPIDHPLGDPGKIIPVIELYPKFKHELEMIYGGYHGLPHDHVCHSLETCYLVFPHDFVYDWVYQIIMLIIHISFGYPLSHTIYITPQQFVR